MKKIIFQVALPVFMCVVFSSCINVNSLNKVERGVSLNYTPDKHDEEICIGSVKTELYFGLLKADGTTVSEEEWQAFVDNSVSPLFTGFTVVDAYGKCKNAEGKVVKEKTKMLIIVQKNEEDDNMDKVKKEFNRAFPKNAFFKVSYPVLSSLDENDDDADNDADEDSDNDKA